MPRLRHRQGVDSFEDGDGWNVSPVTWVEKAKASSLLRHEKHRCASLSPKKAPWLRERASAQNPMAQPWRGEEIWKGTAAYVSLIYRLGPEMGDRTGHHRHCLWRRRLTDIFRRELWKVGGRHDEKPPVAFINHPTFQVGTLAFAVIRATTIAETRIHGPTSCCWGNFCWLTALLATGRDPTPAKARSGRSFKAQKAESRRKTQTTKHGISITKTSACTRWCIIPPKSAPICPPACRAYWLGLVESRLARTALRHVCSALNKLLGPSGSF